MPQLGSILNPNNRTKKWSGVELIASNTLGEVRFSQRDHCVSFLLYDPPQLLSSLGLQEGLQVELRVLEIRDD